jgi:hypothetical protein
MKKGAKIFISLPQQEAIFSGKRKKKGGKERKKNHEKYKIVQDENKNELCTINFYAE